MKVALVDLEGTLIKGDSFIPGSTQLIEHLRENNYKVLLLTNSTRFSTQQLHSKLLENKIDIDECDIVDGAKMAAKQLKTDNHSTIYILGCASFVEELKSFGFEVITTKDHLNCKIEEIPLNPKVTAILVAEDFDFCFLHASIGTRYVIEQKCKFYCVGKDSQFPWNSDTIIPGPYTFATSIKVPSYVDPMIIGKPENVELPINLKDYESILVIGDSEHDIEYAKKIGAKSALVMTGITETVKENLHPSIVLKDLFEATEKSKNKIFCFRVFERFVFDDFQGKQKIFSPKTNKVSQFIMELPHPWEIRESKKYPGRCYYFNSETHESQWIRPVRYPGTDPKKPWPPAMYLFCILIKYKGSLGGDGISRTLDEARSLAEQIFSELQKGDSSFPEMANKYSDDPETRERDGELGWVVWGKFDEKFEKTAWQLKIGETSHPFKTDKGIYLILRRG